MAAVWVPESDDEVWSLKRGMRMEQKAFRALHTLPTPWWVIAVLETETCSGDDCNGVDLLVYTKYGLVALQIKSSYTGLKHHRRKYPGVPCVVVRPGDNLLTTRRNLLKAVSECIEKNKPL